MTSKDSSCLKEIGEVVASQRVSSLLYRDIANVIFSSGTKHPDILAAGVLARDCWGRGENGDSTLAEITELLVRARSMKKPSPGEAVTDIDEIKKANTEPKPCASEV